MKTETEKHEQNYQFFKENILDNINKKQRPCRFSEQFHCFVLRRKATGGHWEAAVTTGRGEQLELCSFRTHEQAILMFLFLVL